MIVPHKFIVFIFDGSVKIVTLQVRSKFLYVVILFSYRINHLRMQEIKKQQCQPNYRSMSVVTTKLGIHRHTMVPNVYSSKLMNPSKK